MSTMRVYDFLWRNFNIYRNAQGTALCYWPANNTIAAATGLAEKTVRTTLANLEKNGLYIRIAFNGKDKGLAPVDKSYERKYSIPLDLGHGDQVAILQECQAYIAQMTEWKDKAKQALAFVEKALTAASKLRTTTIAEDLAFDDGKLKPTVSCLKRFRHASSYSEEALLEAERITRKEDNALKQEVAKLYADTNFKVTGSDELSQFEEHDKRAT
jgi:hypothetical protein